MLSCGLALAMIYLIPCSLALVVVVSYCMFLYVSLQQAEYERMTKDVNRSAYTKRIMEIVANIKKQKTEIDKVTLLLSFFFQL